ncbi:hypothetical protein QJQ45_012462 [Haematococcus lacustris]|nr:hypothetical protein QJQ45_012462 [Haematococcus lacustris]
MLATKPAGGLASVARPVRNAVAVSKRHKKPHVASYALGEDAALQEAAELFMEASRMAQKQVLHELQQMQLTEPRQTADCDPCLHAQQPTPAAPHPGSIRRMPGQQQRASSSSSGGEQQAASRKQQLAALTAFWEEQGLSPGSAARVAGELCSSGSRFADPKLLAAQVQRLSRIMPSPIQDMVARDVRILEASPSTVAQHYVQLVQLFPSTVDIAQLAAKQPRLLYCEDLVQQYDAVVGKLTQLHPSHSRDEARILLAPTGVDKMTQTMLLGSFVEADDGSAQAHDD